LARNRLTWTLVLQSSIKPDSLQSAYGRPEGRPLQGIRVFRSLFSPSVITWE
jgi:hypothetical protein